jgi:hypothetical protein
MDMGTSQIMNAPRAFYADEVGKIGANQVSDNNITDLTRYISISSEALSINSSNTFVSRNSMGIAFDMSYQAQCEGIVAIPSDWDSTTNMIMEIYFVPQIIAIGNVDFFIRVTGRNPGEQLNDPGSSNGAAVAVSNNNTLYKQSFTIPFYKFTGKQTIHIYAIQRQGPSDTYNNKVNLMMVKFVYTARR